MTATLLTQPANADNDANYKGAETVVPGTPFTYTARGIYVGVGGNVTVSHRSGDAVTYVGVPSGTIIRTIALQVNTAGTTATNMVALYS